MLENLNHYHTNSCLDCTEIEIRSSHNDKYASDLLANNGTNLLCQYITATMQYKRESQNEDNATSIVKM